MHVRQGRVLQGMWKPSLRVQEFCPPNANFNTYGTRKYSRMKITAEMDTQGTRDSQKYHHDVVVIGAGISGLACASKLLQDERFAQSKSLLVLEGRDRIGGRINAVYVDGNRLDTGANWVHGIGTDDKPNPLMKILPHKRYKVFSGAAIFKATGDNTTTSNPGGSVDTTTGKDLIIPSSIARIISSGLWETVGGLHELAAQKSPQEAKATTILQAIKDIDTFRKTYDDLPEEYHQTFGSLMQFIENMEAGPLTENTNKSSKDQSAMSLLEYAIEDFDGDQVFLQDGYIAIINEIAQSLINAKLIRLGTKVERIDWSSKPIRIYTNQGEYTTDNLVCTIPLGVLKEQRSTLFEPRLPSNKEQAIEKLGFGTLDKIFLVFKSPWWTEEPYATHLKNGLVGMLDGSENDTKISDTLMGFTEELPGIEIHKDGTVTPGLRSLTVVNLHSLTGFPVLSCFVSCDVAIKIEAMTDHQAATIVHRALTQWFGQEPPRPEAVHVTRWSQDAFSRGSYSHMIVDKSETSHREVFQHPISNDPGAVLYFAGEHTSRNRKSEGF